MIVVRVTCDQPKGVKLGISKIAKYNSSWIFLCPVLMELHVGCELILNMSGKSGAIAHHHSSEMEAVLTIKKKEPKAAISLLYFTLVQT